MISRSSGRAGRLLFVALLGLSVACAAGCGGSPAQGETSSRPLVTQPGGFKDVYDARLATGPGGELWLAETGAGRGGRLRTGVFRFADGRWIALPGRVRSSSDTPLSVAVPAAGQPDRARVCVGFAGAHGQARIRCYLGRRWTDVRLPEWLRKMDLQGLESSPYGSGTVALFTRVGRHSTLVRLVRLGGTRIASMGSGLHLKGQVLATLGERAAGVTSTGIDVGLEDLRYGRRWVATLHPSGWSHTNLISVRSSGPQLGGPVRLPGTLLDALTEAEGNWPMTIHVWSDGDWSQPGSGPLNVGSGQAQGSLNAVGGDAWATWVQTGSASGGMFPTSYYAALLDPSTGEVENRILLWHGRSIGPGPAQAVAFRGYLVFLYVRQHGRKAGLLATVSFYPRATIE